MKVREMLKELSGFSNTDYLYGLLDPEGGLPGPIVKVEVRALTEDEVWEVGEEAGTEALFLMVRQLVVTSRGWTGRTKQPVPTREELIQVRDVTRLGVSAGLEAPVYLLDEQDVLTGAPTAMPIERLETPRVALGDDVSGEWLGPLQPPVVVFTRGHE